nr:Dyp-type peroxidase [uncultured Campylobacter sp.]
MKQNQKKISEIFKLWTAQSANLIEGKNIEKYGSNAFLPPVDTGEADSLEHANLTLTFGVSASFFDKLGLKNKPSKLADLPHFPRDQLKEQFVGGDICIQACADDPQVAFHAARNLLRTARTSLSPKWSQMGFNSFMGSDTPRNLFAFKDGTINPKKTELDKEVWIKGGVFDNGSYLIARKVVMHLETWDRTHLKGQNETFGRQRDSGAPFGKTSEFDEIELSGDNAAPETSHAFLAKSAGAKILRRSYSYASGVNERGALDAGLLFISFQRDPAQFIAIQSALGLKDRMNEYITNIGSGVFACFGGVSRDKNDYIGKRLFS